MTSRIIPVDRQPSTGRAQPGPDVEVSSHWTRRWREMDSNHWSRDKRESCSEARLSSPPTDRHARRHARQHRGGTADHLAERTSFSARGLVSIATSIRLVGGNLLLDFAGSSVFDHQVRARGCLEIRGLASAQCRSKYRLSLSPLARSDAFSSNQIAARCSVPVECVA